MDERTVNFIVNKEATAPDHFPPREKKRTARRGAALSGQVTDWHKKCEGEQEYLAVWTLAEPATCPSCSKTDIFPF